MLSQTLISTEILQEKVSRNELGYALADIINGIRKEWDLSIREIAAILSLPQGTVKGWLKENGHVGLDSVLDHNTQAIIDFIDIYNMIASFIVKTSDQILWFKTPSQNFQGLSPMMLICETPHNLTLVRSLIKNMLNP